MDYDLLRLGPREFEHLSQAIARAELGALISQFGAGPDGGREATWNGQIQSLSSGSWNGYGVIQAKAREESASPGSNLTWLKREIDKELKRWADPLSKRRAKPKCFLLITNVRLSAVPGKGIDAANQYLGDKIRALKLPIQKYRIWHSDDVARMLDAHVDIRTTYAAWITPGDILARILDRERDSDKRFRDALMAHMSRAIIEETQLNLTQAGSASETNLTVADVFTDLPLRPDFPRMLNAHIEDAAHLASKHRAAALLIERSDSASENSRRTESHSRDAEAGTQPDYYRRTVLVGGPGQGKSTVSQYVAQIYRAEFLRSSSLAEGNSDVRNALSAINSSAERLQIQAPRARRWPTRIILTELADALSAGRCQTLIEFIKNQINIRNSSPISTGDVLTWLETYPWILILDGLDEVPKTSNRTQVMRAIQDFFIEATNLNADVTTIATTRPQGYDNNFDPTQYAHFVLEPLSPEIATEFAQSFIQLRSGRDTTRSHELLQRFELAAQAETTSRLMASPLQITILVILIERKGRIPRDRWRLFKSYYEVITQREHAKTGPLAKLLSDHEHDIDQIHKIVGYRLQEQSARAGATSAHLTRDEFYEIVDNRLQEQGYTNQEASDLRTRFVELATERLVFLSFQTSESVEFEIRSLQEFMAAEYVCSGDEPKIIETLRGLAPISHWKNTVLFAIGGIFAQRESLKDGVVTLCQELDLNAAPNSVPKVGATLALNVLLDGSCANQPRFEVLLADRALNTLDGPFSIFSTSFASLASASDRVLSIIRERTKLSTGNLSESETVNRAVLLDRLAGLGHHFADDELRSFVTECDLGVFEALYRAALEIQSPTFSEILDERAKQLGDKTTIRVIQAQKSSRVWRHRVKGLDAGPWIQRIENAISPHFYDNDGTIDINAGDEVVEMTIVSLAEAAQAWSGPLLEMGESEWGTLNALAVFSCEPTPTNLALLLRALADQITEPFITLADLPWPAEACVSHVVVASTIGGWSAERTREEYLQLAALAADGSLGDAGSWRTWESNLESCATPFGHLRNAPIASIGGTQKELPLWPSTDGRHFPLLGLRIVVGIPRTQGEFTALLLLMESLADRLPALEPGTTQNAVIHLIAMLVNSFARALRSLRVHLPELTTNDYVSPDTLDRVKALFSRCRHALAPPACDSALFPVRLDWLDFLDPGSLQREVGLESLRAYGRNSQLEVMRMPDHVPELVSLWSVTGEREYLRLAVHLDASKACILLRDQSVKTPESPDHFFVLANATIESLHLGELDANVNALWAEFSSRGGHDTFRSLLVGMSQSLPLDLATELNLRIANTLMRTEPFIAADFVDAASVSSMR